MTNGSHKCCRYKNVCVSYVATGLVPVILNKKTTLAAAILNKTECTVIFYLDAQAVHPLATKFDPPLILCYKSNHMMT